MYDTGANVNIVVTSLAERLGLQGRAVQQTITTAGGDRTVHSTKQYWLPLQKRSGEVHKVLCIGMDRITEDVGLVDVKRLRTCSEWTIWMCADQRGRWI